MTSESGADFSWIDSERLIRYGRTALDDATRLLPDRGFDRWLRTHAATSTTPSPQRAQ